MFSTYDVIVLGAGSIGMSAGYYISRKGLKVLLIDAYDPPHQHGSHHGQTRLIRHAYASGEPYVSLALRAHELWNELEQETETSLLLPTGVLNINRPDSQIHLGKAKASRLNHLSVEIMDSAEINARWPGWQLPEGFSGLYEEKAGLLYCDACIAAYRKLALANGAEILPNTTVTGIGAFPGHVRVETQFGSFRADKVIVTMGAWSGNLLKSLKLPITVVRKPAAWFQADRSLYGSDRFPGFTINLPEGEYYGFPDLHGSGIKIGRHDSGMVINPNDPQIEFGNYPEDEGELRKVLSAYLPFTEGKLLRGIVCKYEMTPDEDFIIDQHPESPNIYLACGFSGHGFKFASVTGELLADWAVSGSASAKPTGDLSRFSLTRFK